MNIACLCTGRRFYDPPDDFAVNMQPKGRLECLALGFLPRAHPPAVRLLEYQQRYGRSIATHAHAHHATAVSILPTNVDTLATDYKENARQMGEVMARMNELHARIERGGSEKARQKHIGRGKMLPREYASGTIPLIFWRGAECSLAVSLHS